MAGSENDRLNKQDTDSNVHEEANIYEDEVNLIDYFLVLWKHKWLILLGSVLLTLIVGLVFFFSPRKYEVTYVYDVRDDVSNWNLNEINYNVFLSRFYSEENLNTIINKLREKGLNEDVELLSNLRDNLNKFVKFEPVPSYINLSEAEVTNVGQLEQFQKLTAQLLNMTIVREHTEDLPKISSVIRDNFENVIPAYMVQKQLSTKIRTYKTKMADIESNRFGLELTLKTNSLALEKLKSMKTRVSEKAESDVTLQFNISSRSEYLPLGYQIQAVESKIVELEKQVKVNEAKYKYYKDLLALNQKLFAESKSNVSSYYTIQQFHSYLTELVASYETKELKDYLASYIKRIENRISASSPVSENPKIFLIAKGTAKKNTIVFAIALMMLTFAAFLLEGLKKKVKLRLRSRQFVAK